VCGFRGLDQPAYRGREASGETCACCGNQLGEDDRTLGFGGLRRRWEREGMPWWDIARPPPPGWSPQAQLEALGQPDWRPVLDAVLAFLNGQAGAIATARSLADYHEEEGRYGEAVDAAFQILATVDSFTDDVIADPAEPASPGVRTGAAAREAEAQARPLVEEACETLLRLLPVVGFAG
jgi:hypothetical protein